MSTEHLCVVCRKPIGNDVFTVCDDCWDVESRYRREARNLKDAELDGYKAGAKHLREERDKLRAKIEAVRGWATRLSGVGNSYMQELGKEVLGLLE
jgi:hypothetical protein